MKELLKKFPRLYSSLVYIKRRFLSDASFVSSKKYWINRYHQGGNSGAGSYNNLAEFKGEILNDFVKKHNIKNVLEMGCGDGNQLSYFNFPTYTGLDISPKAIKISKQKFRDDNTKQFLLLNGKTPLSLADLVLSLDVLYHLVEDEVYTAYMTKLFSLSEKFVIIYSCNFEDNGNFPPHVRPRKFTKWVEDNVKQFRLIEKIENKYPYDKENVEHTSFADFYIYQNVITKS